MKGILFSKDLIPLVLSGAKTVTRRVMKPQPTVDYMSPVSAERQIEDFIESVKPRYCPGETVYLKETWRRDDLGEDVYYKADWTEKELKECFQDQDGSWKSPLMMPEWASRCKLLIKDVRAERLQEITEEEAKLEGAQPGYYLPDGSFNTWKNDVSYVQMIMFGGNYRDGFRWLWYSINGPGSWTLNPWVFRYEFERVN